MDGEKIGMTARFSGPWWRPTDETAATTNQAALIEFARATHPDATISPRTTFADFAGLDAALGVRGNLLRHDGPREALVWVTPTEPNETTNGEAPITRHVWSRDQLRAGGGPPWFDSALANISWRELGRVLAELVITHDIRPDDRLAWLHPMDDPWPLCALTAGATLVVIDPGCAGAADTSPAGIANAEGARILDPAIKPPASGPDAA